MTRRTPISTILQNFIAISQPTPEISVIKNPADTWRSQKLCAGADLLRVEGLEAPKPPNGVSSGRGVVSPSRLGDKRPQTHFLHILSHRTLHVERKYYFQLNSAEWTTGPTIILSLSSLRGGNCPQCPPWLRHCADRQKNRQVIRIGVSPHADRRHRK